MKSLGFLWTKIAVSVLAVCAIGGVSAITFAHAAGTEEKESWGVSGNIEFSVVNDVSASLLAEVEGATLQEGKKKVFESSVSAEEAGDDFEEWDLGETLVAGDENTVVFTITIFNDEENMPLAATLVGAGAGIVVGGEAKKNENGEDIHVVVIEPKKNESFTITYTPEKANEEGMLSFDFSLEIGRAPVATEAA
ncbi:MAG: hypothetical protein LBM01_00775 [Christensenellaceae bacterium]|jgi:hypothetical protein|nr:hypothetical protein [Christensenellaceae bacterium]